jgi:hypothetical protein
MKATFKNFQVSATYTGSKKAPWDNAKSRMPENWNHHRVTVKNTENGLKTSFDFWMSISRPQIEKEYDVLNAFYCFVSDAISGGYSFGEFCGEFGYDEDSRTAERTFKACERAAAKLSRLYDGNIYDLANELQEIAG